MKLWIKILIAMGLGIVAGAVFGEKTIWIKPVGSLFLNLVNMIIVLLVFSSMTVGITRIHDPKKLGRVGLKTLFLYLATTVVSIFIGLFFAFYFEPGVAANLKLLPIDTPVTIEQGQSLSEIFLSIIPKNPIAALVDGRVLQIIVFSMFFGLAISLSGEKGRPLLEMVESLADVMFRVTSIVMEFSPFGVFALMAWISGTFGLQVLIPLGKFLMLYYAACLIHVFIVFVGLLRTLGGLRVMPFFKGMSDAIMVAFSTASSSATLPVSMHCVQENLGVSKSLSSFILPLGSTVNMNGTAIYQAMSAVFLAQVYNIQLDFYTLAILVVTATLSAVGTAGIPGSGFIVMSAVLSSVGLPLEGIGLLAGIDRLRDMASSVLNILGDAVVAVLVAKQEGELDEFRYYNEEMIPLEGSES